MDLLLNRPNFKITPDMYIVLEQVYGEDKAKAQTMNALKKLMSQDAVK